MDARLLQWLDTHLVHHRWEWSRLNVLRPLLKRLICDPYEQALNVPYDWADDHRLSTEDIEERFQLLPPAVVREWDNADDNAAYDHLTAARDEEDEPFDAAMRRRSR